MSGIRSHLAPPDKDGRETRPAGGVGAVGPSCRVRPAGEHNTTLNLKFPLLRLLRKTRVQRWPSVGPALFRQPDEPMILPADKLMPICKCL